MNKKVSLTMIGVFVVGAIAFRFRQVFLKDEGFRALFWQFGERPADWQRKP